MGLFLIGFVCVIAGGWMLLNQVTVSGGGWTLWGYNSFGLSLLPLLVGIGVLFFDGRSVIGWLLLIAGAVIILAGVLMNMRIYFQSTSLFNTVVMLGLLAAGIGLVARSFRSAERAVGAASRDDAGR
ncbi:hypothetical protein [Chiayiivirga flava]|uniref:Putative membrane channel-forming protein YqfA (Hemolysin III family) n=1 Tax=Chiayiivirga flava TaxID=659595 RepID=A0A7W8D460_9GAMM|nr:hypothetical protein [Chiayiivirga flava]MBB5207613.1 putative membrane channel-forming protein YqfA (hemolysin III family) [Chiayiivirga flava]